MFWRCFLHILHKVVGTVKSLLKNDITLKHLEKTCRFSMTRKEVLGICLQILRMLVGTIKSLLKNNITLNNFNKICRFIMDPTQLLRNF